MSEEAQPQQQEINTVNNHHPHMSMDELLKVIKGANGMPVLFVPSSDGRLAAVAVDGLQNLVVPTRTNRDDTGSADKKQQDFRAWLLVLTSLIATVTYTAGLTPPGGFWAAADKANGYVAGTSVMHSIFRTRYLLFYYSNATAFFTSLMVIAMLAKSINSKHSTIARYTMFRVVVILCLFSLTTSYVAATWEGLRTGVYTIVVILSCVAYLLAYFVTPDHFISSQRRERSLESVA